MSTMRKWSSIAQSNPPFNEVTVLSLSNVIFRQKVSTVQPFLYGMEDDLKKVIGFDDLTSSWRKRKNSADDVDLVEVFVYHF